MPIPQHIADSIARLDKGLVDQASYIEAPNLTALKTKAIRLYKGLLKELVVDALKSSAVSSEELKAFVDEAYPSSYLSVAFKETLKHYTYQDFPYSDITQKKFNSLIAGLKAKKTASAVEKFLEGFKDKKNNSQDYCTFLMKEFRPRHPLYYYSRVLESKERNHYKIQGKTVLMNVSKILSMPQLHSKVEILFAMALALGFDLTTAVKIDDVRLNEPGSIKVKVKGSKSFETRSLICDENHLMNTWNFLLNSNANKNESGKEKSKNKMGIGPKYATNTPSDIPTRILGIEAFTTRSLPQLHEALARFYLDTPPSSSNTALSSFEIEGDKIPLSKALDEIALDIETQKTSTLDMQAETIKKHFSEAQKYFNENPYEKITSLSLRKIMLYTPAIQVLDIFKSVYKVGGLSA